MTTTPARPRLKAIAEAARYIDTTERHLRRLVAENRIPVTRVGGKLRFDLNRLDAWLDENTSGPEQLSEHGVEIKGASGDAPYEPMPGAGVDK